MSNKDYLKWVEKPELFNNLIKYLSENIVYVNIDDRKINANDIKGSRKNILRQA